MAGGTEADLTIRATQTQLYVCRVNDILQKYVFSEWVKVKVLDIDKTGTLLHLNSVHESDVVMVFRECVLRLCQS